MALGIFTHPTGAFAQLDPNDPWPKYGQNIRNTYRSPFRGPHTVPELRWWAPAGFGNGCSGVPGDYRSGAAIARVSGVRYIFVPGNDCIDNTPRDPKVQIFRFHPCGAGGGFPATAATPIAAIDLTQPDPLAGEIVLSTPLILKRMIGSELTTLLIIQTTMRVRCYTLELPAECGGPVPVELRWTYPSSGAFETTDQLEASSPTVSNPMRDGSGADYLIVQANRLNEDEISTTYLHRLQVDAADPGATAVRFPIRTEGTSLSSPAVGPASDAVRNLVYAATFADNDEAEFGAIAMDSTGCRTIAYIDLCAVRPGCPPPDYSEIFVAGTYGSPSVHDPAADGFTSAHVVIASDNTGIYSWVNADVPGACAPPPLLTERSHTCVQRIADCPRIGESFSGTAVVFPNRYAMWINEGASVHRIADPVAGTLSQAGTFGSWGIGKTWEWTHLSGESLQAVESPGRVPERAFVGTVAGEDVGEVFALFNDVDDGQIPQAWRDTSAQLIWANPDTPIPGCELDLRAEIEGPIAIDEDGTLIVCNRGYVVALRPLRGDLNGDGCRNAFDIDAFAAAITAEPQWRLTYTTLGPNLLGIADCNDDGVFNNFDIDAFAELVVNDSRCAIGFGGVECESDPGGLPGGESAACGGEDWDHFWFVINSLRQQFGME